MAFVYLRARGHTLHIRSRDRAPIAANTPTLFASVLFVAVLLVGCGSPPASVGVPSSTAAVGGVPSAPLSAPTPEPATSTPEATVQPPATATETPAPTATNPPAASPTPSPAPTSQPASSATPQTTTVTASAWVSPDDGWLAVGGVILGTDDAGATWAELSTLSADVRSLDFATPDDGWAATASGLYSTQDGGRTWQTVATGGTADVLRVDFADPEHGWALPDAADAAKQVILRTVDGGQRWSSLPTPCDGRFGSAAFSFYDQTSGWLVCGGEPGAGSQAKYLYRTDDGGSSWKLASQTAAVPLDPTTPKSLPTSGYVADLFFRDESHGWLATSRGGLLHTVDGGKTWQPVTSLYGERFPRSPRFFSEERGYALDTSGGQTVLLGTRDSGATWQKVYPTP